MDLSDDDLIRKWLVLFEPLRGFFRFYDPDTQHSIFIEQRCADLEEFRQATLEVAGICEGRNLDSTPLLELAKPTLYIEEENGAPVGASKEEWDQAWLLVSRLELLESNVKSQGQAEPQSTAKKSNRGRVGRRKKETTELAEKLLREGHTIEEVCERTGLGAGNVQQIKSRAGLTKPRQES